MADSKEGPNFKIPTSAVKHQKGGKTSPTSPMQIKNLAKQQQSSTSGSDSDSSSSSYSVSDYEEAESELEKEAADAEALGIDLQKYMKKEAFEFYKDKIEDRIQDMMETIDIMDGKLHREILEKESEYHKGVSIIERRLEEHMVPVREEVDILMKTRAR